MESYMEFNSMQEFSRMFVVKTLTAQLRGCPYATNTSSILMSFRDEQRRVFCVCLCMTTNLLCLLCSSPFPADCGFFVWKNQQQICFHCFKWARIFWRKINFVVHLLSCINNSVGRKNLNSPELEIQIPEFRYSFLQLCFVYDFLHDI